MDDTCQNNIDLTNPPIRHELIRTLAINNAIINITTDFGHILPVSEIKLDHIYYKDSQEVIDEWRKSNTRDWIEFD